MARPTKSTKALSDYSQTKDEIREREQMEKKLMCEGLPSAPEWLNERQKEIYENIIDFLKDSEMLALNDVFILTQTAVAIERLEYIEKIINNDLESVTDKNLASARRGYASDFYRGCNELCLSPQSRAKLANAAVTKQKKAPLEEIIGEAGEL